MKGDGSSEGGAEVNNIRCSWRTMSFSRLSSECSYSHGETSQCVYKLADSGIYVAEVFAK